MLRITVFGMKDSAHLVEDVFVDSIDEIHGDPDGMTRIDCTANRVPIHFMAKRYQVKKVKVLENGRLIDVPKLGRKKKGPPWQKEI